MSKVPENPERLKPMEDRVLFGAAYYAEYQPDDHLAEDMRLMREASFSVIRVGEGSWSHWEPEEGVFHLDWLQPILDAAQDQGIKVIIGMPTFAIPQWMRRKYPEVALVGSDGRPMPFGSREEHNYNHPVFLYFAQQVIGRIVERYKDHPAVIGWQVHNEPGLKLNYSRDAFEGFRDWLRHRYGTVENLNKQWGLVFWSHELSDWSDLWSPEGNVQPQYDLAWRRYNAERTSEMIAWQRDLVRERCRDDQFITTCVSPDRVAQHEAEVCDPLDITSTNPYFHTQDGLKLHGTQILKPCWYPSGPWSVGFLADRSYAMRQQNYLVTETDGGPIGGPTDNYPCYDGQWRQTAFQLISRGCEMVEYWHWQQLHWGAETYWGGVLPHSRKPGRIYQRIAELGAEIARDGADIAGITPDADIALLYSVQSKWGLSFMPHRSDDYSDPHRQRNENSYLEINDAFYHGAFASGRQVRIFHDVQLVDDEAGKPLVEAAAFAKQYPVLVAAGLYVASPTMLAWLQAYAQAGGTLILGPRSCYADRDARPSLEDKPTLLSVDAQADYDEFSVLYQPVAVQAEQGMALREGSAATEWVDCYHAQGATSLASCDHPHFGQFDLITEAADAQGSVICVGCVPNWELAASVYDHVLGGTRTGSAAWTTGSANLTHSSGINREGHRVHFLFNWSWEPASQKLPTSCVPAGGGDPTDTVELGPWDVKVLLEA